MCMFACRIKPGRVHRRLAAPREELGLQGRRRETFTLILLYLLSLERCECITYSKSVSCSTTNTNVM